MAGIRLQLDPTAMVAGAAQAESALERVGREAIQAEGNLDRLGARGGASVQRMGGAMSAASGVMGRFGPKMQQIGFQVGDFATQVGAGTSATQALGQQLPQLLGGFGAVGAVMGAVAAIAIPLGAAFFNMGSEAQSVSDAVDDLSGSAESYIDAAKAAAVSTDELIAKYGALASEARNALSAMADAEFANVIMRTNSAVSAVLGSLTEMRTFASSDMLGASETARALADSFGMAQQDAAALREALDALASAQGLREQAMAADEVNRALIAAYGSAEAMPGPLQEAYRAMAQVVAEAGLASAAADDMAIGFDDVASAARSAALAAESIGSAAAGAIGSVQALGKAMWDAAQARIAAQDQLSQMAIEFSPGGQNALKYGGRGALTPQQEALSKKYDMTGAIKPPSSGRARGGGGGGGGENEAEKAARAYDSLLGSLDPVIRADQEFAEAQKTVNAALDAGYISAEQAASTIALARDEMDKAKASAEGAAGAWQDMFETGGSALDKLIAGTGKFSDVLKQALVDMVALLTKRALLGSVTGGLATDSVGTLITKSLFGGFFDNGGAMAIGSIGIVGERGPELVASTSRGAVVTSRTDTAAMRGGAQILTGNIGVTVDGEGNVKAYVQRMAVQAAQSAYAAALQDTRRNLGGWNQQLNTDGALV